MNIKKYLMQFFLLHNVTLSVINKFLKLVNIDSSIRLRCYMLELQLYLAC